MKKNTNNVKRTICPEVSLAQNIALSIADALAKDNAVTDDNLEDVLSMAVSMMRIAYREARKSFDEKERNKIQDEIDDKVKKAAEFVDKAFGAEAMVEAYLAESEGREININRLKKVAKRLVRAAFKDIEGVDVNNLEVEISEDSKSINIIIPKEDEE